MVSGQGGASGIGGEGAGGIGGAVGGGGATGPVDARDAAPGDAPASGDGPSGPVEPVGGCSSDGWCWMRPRPTGNIIYDVGGTASNDVWAWGSAGTAQHWDGRTWTAHAVNGEIYDVFSMFAVGPDDVWATGGSGSAHWDGVSWTRSPMLGSATIAGTAPDDVWAVLSGGELMHLQQSDWAPYGMAGSSCSALWVSSPTDIWIGCETLYHYDGSTFVDTGTVPGAFQLSGSGANDVWAATPTGVWHWNGSTWAQAGLATPGVTSLSVRGPGDVWALDQNDALHHRVGTSWRQTWQGEPSTTRCVWAFGGDVWIGGAGGLLLRGDGTTFSPTTDTPIIPQVWARSVYGAANRVWIGTDDGVQIWDGTTFTQMAGTAGRSFQTIWASAVDDVWMIDNNTGLSRWNGTTFEKMLTGPLGFLSGTSANDVWAGFQHWDGQTWTTTGTPDAGYTVTGMWASGPSDAWIVGSGGYIKHWDGTTWTRVTGLGSALFTTIWGTGPNDVWLGGENEQVLRWDGQKWNPIHNLSGGAQIRGFAGAPGNIWVLGGKTGAMHWDGVTLSTSWLGTYQYVNSLWAGSALGVFAAGGGGILHHAY